MRRIDGCQLQGDVEVVRLGESATHHTGLISGQSLRVRLHQAGQIAARDPVQTDDLDVGGGDAIVQAQTQLAQLGVRHPAGQVGEDVAVERVPEGGAAQDDDEAAQAREVALQAAHRRPAAQIARPQPEVPVDDPQADGPDLGHVRRVHDVHEDVGVARVRELQAVARVQHRRGFAVDGARGAQERWAEPVGDACGRPEDWFRGCERVLVDLGADVSWQAEQRRRWKLLFGHFSHHMDGGLMEMRI